MIMDELIATNDRLTSELAEARATVTKLTTLAEAVDVVRNNIIGTQSFNWSRDAYPLVAALGDAGYPGEGYDVARASIHGYQEETAALNVKLAAKTSECERLREVVRDLRDADIADVVGHPPMTAAEVRSASDAYAPKDVGASGSPVAANTRSHLRGPARGGHERATSAQWPQCSCAEIQAGDVSRHFRECLRRAVYPHPSAQKPQLVEPQGPDSCRKGTPGCTVDHTGMLGGYSECVAPNSQSTEPAKVVSVISLSDRPQSTEPAKVEAPERMTLVKTVDRGWMVRFEIGPGTVDYVRLDIHAATQTDLAAANAADEAHRKGCDIAMTALAQAEAERDMAVDFISELRGITEWRPGLRDWQSVVVRTRDKLSEYDAKKGGTR